MELMSFKMVFSYKKIFASLATWSKFLFQVKYLIAIEIIY